MGLLYAHRAVLARGKLRFCGLVLRAVFAGRFCGLGARREARRRLIWIKDIQDFACHARAKRERARQWIF
jgi:hypothetical protein